MKLSCLILLVVLSVCCQLASGCKDKYKKSCPGWKESCVDPIWTEWMEKNCKKTCNACPANNCKDKFKKSCPDWKEFCVDPDWTEWMEKYCTKTCDACPDSGTDTGSCETTNGACIFPFEYDGVTYNGCTTAGDYLPWCRTSTDETQEWWGNCGDECKMHQDTVVTTTEPTVTTTEPIVTTTEPTVTTTEPTVTTTEPTVTTTEPTVTTTEPTVTTTAATSSQCGIENMPTTRISGGSETAPNQFPWMVRLPMGCGGAFITDRHILTAKHCVEAHGTDWRGQMVKMSVHDQYDPEDFQEVEIKDYVMPPISENHDIAIIILAKSVDLSDNTIGTVCLPASADEDYRGKRALAMGWGWDPKTESQSQKLQKLEMTVDDTQEDLWLYTKVVFNDEGVPLDVCNGDSGGPLVYKEGGRYTIIGTVMGGDYCNNHQGNSGTWNKVTGHLKWINSVIAN